MRTKSSILAAVLIGLVPVHSYAQEPSTQAAEPVALAEPTLEETAALLNSINKLRTDSALNALIADDTLSKRAGLAFPAALNSPGIVDVTEIRSDYKAEEVAVLRGIVTHRGAASGGEIPKYWVKEEPWKEILLGDFTHIGAATVKRSDGKLVAYAYLLKK